MRGAVVAAMPGEEAPAQRLAALLGAALAPVEVHHFPDGESRVRALDAARTTVVYCSLNRPNEKLIELAFAAAALRDLGAERLVLAAPYLCYMRQDKAFRLGEAVSQRVIGGLLAQSFDRIVTIEPHLHRVRSLSDVFPGREATALSAAPLLAAMIRRDGAVANGLIVGPDRESRRWTEALAAALGAEFIVLDKTRRGDGEVSITVDEDAPIAGRRAYLVDDVASTGGTLAAAARLLAAKGAASIEAVVVHALCSGADLDRLRGAGLARLRSTDSVAHATNAIEVAPLLASALAQEGAL